MSEAQNQLLASWRKMLALCLNLQLALGAERAPAEIALGIVEARGQIASLKQSLRDAGERVADQPDELALGDADEIAHQLRLLETIGGGWRLSFGDRRSLPSAICRRTSPAASPRRAARSRGSSEGCASGRRRSTIAPTTARNPHKRPCQRAVASD